MCCTEAFALRNAPRRRGSTLLVTMAMAQIMRRDIRHHQRAEQGDGDRDRNRRQVSHYQQQRGGTSELRSGRRAACHSDRRAGRCWVS